MKDKNIYDFLRNEIDNAIKSGLFKNEKELADKAEICVSNFNRFRKGERNNITFDTAYNLLKTLNFDIKKNDEISSKKKTATIQRMGTNSPMDEINENDKELIKYVPVCTCAGAGAEIDYDAVNEVDFVPILKEYWHENLRIVKIEGDSMDPTIKDGSCVGVIPYTSKKLKAGKIYLVNIPDFGYVVKRVYPGEKQGTIQLVSDNKNHKDKTIDCSGYEHVIIAEVVWVWQKM